MIAPRPMRINLRVGINIGDIVGEDGDIFGDGVNVAARLEALAEPGGICVSAQVRDAAAGKLDLAFTDIGEQALKNIARPIHAYWVETLAASSTPPNPGLALPEKPSIAGRPLQNMSGHSGQEYFVDDRRITVFLSYTQADRGFAHSLVAALSERLPPNIQFLLDADIASPGENVFLGVAVSLSKADALIVIISQASTSSAWVRSEVAWALAQKDGKLPIFPVLTGPPDAIPYLLRSRVYINFSDNRNFTENVNRLAQAILRSLDASRLAKTEHLFEDSIEAAFIEMQQSILETQRLTEARERHRLGARLSIAMALVITIFSFSAIGIVYSLNGGVLNNIMSIAIAPLVGLVGILLGFYFGVSSYSPRETEVEEREALKRGHGAS